MSYSNTRFNRKYKLFIRFSATDVVEILPPLRIAFEAKKTIVSDVNELKLQIYNLTQDKRNKLIKDKAQVANQEKYLQVILQVGYKDLVDVFIGNVYEASSTKKGADFITTLTCKDGGFDFRNSFTAKSITKKISVVDELLKDMPNTKKGKVTEQDARIRPKILIGNTSNLIQENLSENETFFIDNEKLNIIKEDELIEEFAVLVSEKTGLLHSPDKSENFVIVDTLMNPQIKCGGQVQLVSSISDLDNLYRVDTIEFKGDYRGSDWMQTLYLRRSTNFKVVK